MRYSEVLERIKNGDSIVNVFYRKNVYYVMRNEQRIFDLNYNQFEKLTKGLDCKILCGGFTKHIYKYNNLEK